MRTTKVFVGGLSQSTTEERLEEFFNRYGKVKETFMAYDRTTQRPRGFGFITFDTPEEVEELCKNRYVVWVEVVVGSDSGNNGRCCCLC